MTSTPSTAHTAPAPVHSGRPGSSGAAATGTATAGDGTTTTGKSGKSGTAAAAQHATVTAGSAVPGGTTPAEAPKRSRSVTRERLLAAAAAVFAERGIVGASVEEVCDRAGFTRGAFYSNFATKDELLVALLDREEAALLDRLTAALTLTLDSPDPLQAAVERLFELQPFGAAKYALRAELSLLAVRDPQLAAPYLATRTSFRERFQPFLRAALASAGLDLTVSADDALDTLEALFEASVRAGIVAGDPNGRDNLARRMLPLVLAAMTRPAATD